MKTHRIYFKARNWEFNKSCLGNVGDRSFISSILGQLEEVYKIGAPNSNRTEIVSKPMMLVMNSIYHIYFWLQVGENRNGTCQLHVIFDGKSDEAYQYKLYGGYITPLKVVSGWCLYDVSFETQTNSVTQLKFVVENTTVTIMRASDPEEYWKLPDGREAKQNSVKTYDTTKKKHNPFDFGPYTTNSAKDMKLQDSKPAVPDALSKKEREASALYQQILQKLDDGCIKEQIVEDIMEQLVQRVERDIDLDGIVKEFSDTVDVQQLHDEIRNVIKNHVGKTH